MTIERMYVDHPDEWKEISEEEFVRRTEWAGYFKKGTALRTLKDAGRLRTPWAFYRISLDDHATLAEVNVRRGHLEGVRP